MVFADAKKGYNSQVVSDNLCRNASQIQFSMVSSHGHVAKPEDQVKSSKTFTGNWCKKALGCSNLFHVEVKCVSCFTW